MSPASKKRKSPQGRPRRDPALAAIGAALLTAFTDRLDDEGPLQSELLLGCLLGVSWGRAQWGRTEATEAFTDEMLMANWTGHPAGGLALLTFARVGPPALRNKARELLEQGLTSGVTKWRMPGGAQHCGTAELGRTANPEPHLLVVLVDYNLHVIKDMFIRVGPGIFEFLAKLGANDDGATFAPMDLQAASDDISLHLNIIDHTIGEPFGEESAEVR